MAASLYLLPAGQASARFGANNSLLSSIHSAFPEVIPAGGAGQPFIYDALSNGVVELTLIPYESESSERVFLNFNDPTHVVPLQGIVPPRIVGPVVRTDQYLFPQQLPSVLTSALPLVILAERHVLLDLVDPIASLIPGPVQLSFNEGKMLLAPQGILPEDLPEPELTLSAYALYPEGFKATKIPPAFIFSGEELEDGRVYGVGIKLLLEEVTSDSTNLPFSPGGAQPVMEAGVGDTLRVAYPQVNKPLTIYTQGIQKGPLGYALLHEEEALIKLHLIGTYYIPTGASTQLSFFTRYGIEPIGIPEQGMTNAYRVYNHQNYLLPVGVSTGAVPEHAFVTTKNNPLRVLYPDSVPDYWWPTTATHVVNVTREVYPEGIIPRHMGACEVEIYDPFLFPPGIEPEKENGDDPQVPEEAYISTSPMDPFIEGTDFLVVGEDHWVYTNPRYIHPAGQRYTVFDRHTYVAHTVFTVGETVLWGAAEVRNKNAAAENVTLHDQLKIGAPSLGDLHRGIQTDTVMRPQIPHPHVYTDLEIYPCIGATQEFPSNTYVRNLDRSIRIYNHRTGIKWGRPELETAWPIGASSIEPDRKRVGTLFISTKERTVAPRGAQQLTGHRTRIYNSGDALGPEGIKSDFIGGATWVSDAIRSVQVQERGVTPFGDTAVITQRFIHMRFVGQSPNTLYGKTFVAYQERYVAPFHPSGCTGCTGRVKLFRDDRTIRPMGRFYTEHGTRAWIRTMTLHPLGTRYSQVGGSTDVYNQDRKCYPVSVVEGYQYGDKTWASLKMRTVAPLGVTPTIMSTRHRVWLDEPELPTVEIIFPQSLPKNSNEYPIQGDTRFGNIVFRPQYVYPKGSDALEVSNKAYMVNKAALLLPRPLAPWTGISIATIYPRPTQYVFPDEPIMAPKFKKPFVNPYHIYHWQFPPPDYEPWAGNPGKWRPMTDTIGAVRVAHQHRVIYQYRTSYCQKTGYGWANIDQTPQQIYPVGTKPIPPYTQDHILYGGSRVVTPYEPPEGPYWGQTYVHFPIIVEPPDVDRTVVPDGIAGEFGQARFSPYYITEAGKIFDVLMGEEAWISRSPRYLLNVGNIADGEVSKETYVSTSPMYPVIEGFDSLYIRQYSYNPATRKITKTIVKKTAAPPPIPPGTTMYIDGAGRDSAQFGGASLTYGSITPSGISSAIIPKARLYICPCNP